MRKTKDNRYRIEYEFDLFVENRKCTSRQDIIDCIGEDTEEAITRAIVNITGDMKKRGYRVLKL